MFRESPGAHLASGAPGDKYVPSRRHSQTREPVVPGSPFWLRGRVPIRHFPVPGSVPNRNTNPEPASGTQNDSCYQDRKCWNPGGNSREPEAVSSTTERSFVTAPILVIGS